MGVTDSVGMRGELVAAIERDLTQMRVPLGQVRSLAISPANAVTLKKEAGQTCRARSCPGSRADKNDSILQRDHHDTCN